MLELTDASFYDCLANSKLLLVDFWASWCPPCKVLMPILEELSSEYSGRIKMAKINVDENPKLSIDYGVKTIPTVIIFQDGKLVHRFSGVKTKKEISDMISSCL